MTLLPRGLHHVAIEVIQAKLHRSNHKLDVQLLGESGDVTAAKLSQLLLESRVAMNNKKKRNKDESILPTMCLPVGNLEIKPSNEIVAVSGKNQTQYTSLGYRDKDLLIWSQAGDGDVWVHIRTDAPVTFVANQLRCIGPLLALVQISDNIDLHESHSLEEAMESLQTALRQRRNCFDAALDIWYRHVQCCWSLSQAQNEEVAAKYQGKTPMTFRFSCVRSESKRYKYTRQQFLAAAGTFLVPDKMLDVNAETIGKRAPWKVDLSNFDVEIVFLVHPHSLAIGLSLRPYLQADALTFASGKIPPDITPPYIPGRITAGFVRLRPTTAQLLLHLANLQIGEVVLDPCAGIGTIPIETMFVENAAIGLGGDLAITGDSDGDLGSVASSYAQQARAFQNQSNTRYRGVADLLAWDATNLPLRAESVDVVVSDLPFGQHCMSSTKLASFLPLLFGELARVLQPGCGRMVLLCGSFPVILESLLKINQSSSPAGREINEGSVWDFPCQSIFPVNIGGLLAWVIQVKRGTGSWRQVQHHRDRSRNLVARRAHINSCDQSNKIKNPQQQKYRRIQR
jgi:hypothetical protein